MARQYIPELKIFEREVMGRIMAWDMKADEGCKMLRELLDKESDPLTVGTVRRILTEIDEKLGIKKTEE